MTNKIVVADDEPTLISTLRFNLEKEGFLVLSAATGEGALELVRSERPDLLILDLMLPGMHGFEVCRIVRREMNIPIIILSARTDDVDKVVALEAGADDYMTKPFSMNELLARVRVQLRHPSPMRPEAGDLFAAGDLVMDTARREARNRGAVLNLTAKEFELLLTMVRNRGRVLSRSQLLRTVWGYEAYGQTRTVDVHVARLRRQLEADPANPVRIITIRGLGYRFD